MAEIHQLVLAFGRERARELASEIDPKLFDLASQVLSEESQAIGITYAGFCLTSLPHKRLADDQPWRRSSHRLTLLIEPGRLPPAERLYGVPFGSRARLILIYLTTMALRNNSPEVELGRSMRDWLHRMSVSLGGKSYQDVREQANRISACRLTFSWDQGNDSAFIRDSVVIGGLSTLEVSDESKKEERSLKSVRLSDTFFNQLKKHPVPIWEPALKYIANQSMAIDVYLWLTYRLHILNQATPISWRALHGQFGAGYKRLDHFRHHFTSAVKSATLVYPDARVDIDQQGLILHPSRPPIAPRTVSLVAKRPLENDIAETTAVPE